MNRKILIYIVAYNAEAHIRQVLDRIPGHYKNSPDVTLYIADDASQDQTTEVARKYAEQHGLSVTVDKHPQNLGYGGNQKYGYDHAIRNGYDYVVLLHGDGQYAPEYLDSILAPLLENKADLVLGSRMIRKLKALKGGMPVYKWVGNIGLTRVQNVLLGVSLSEFHTGYRAFRVSTLADIPFHENSDGFVFDTQIIIQIIDKNKRITEVDIPTFYGDEISHVKCIRYGSQVLMKTLAYRCKKSDKFS